MRQLTVIRFGALGDTLMLTPVFRYLHRLSETPVHYLGKAPWSEQLLAHETGIGALAQIASKRTPGAFNVGRRGAAAWLREHARGTVLDLESDDFSAALLDAAGIPAQRVIRGRSVRGMRPYKHQVHSTLARVRTALEERGDVDDLDTALGIAVPDAWHTDATAWLAARGWSDDPLILLAPGNKRTMSWRPHWRRSNRKHWPLSEWARLCERLLAHDAGGRILIVGAPAEQRLARIIARKTRSQRVHAVCDDMPTTRMMALMRRAQGAITLDSGPAHAAAAVDCPVVTLFNATDPERFLPLPPSGRVRAVTPGDRPLADWMPGPVTLAQVERAWHGLRTASREPGPVADIA